MPGSRSGGRWSSSTPSSGRTRSSGMAPPPGLSADDLEQLAGRNAVALRETAGGEWVRHIYVPMSIPTARPALIEVTESLQAVRRYINMNHLQIAVATALIAA